MAFRVAELKANGERIQSVLVNKEHALLSSSDDATIQVDSKQGTYVKISEVEGLCQLETQGVEVQFRDKTIVNETITLGTGSEFSIHNQKFYTTLVNDGSPTKFKKVYLATVAIVLTWSLLLIQIFVPAWLPFKITSHTSEGRDVIAENCSTELDSLRHQLKSVKGKIASISPIHNDIVNNLSEELDKITWTYRNAGEFMPSDQLKTLINDIQRYKKVLSTLENSQVISVKPVNENKIIQGLKL